MQVWPGQPYPLGATYDGAGTNFAVFSESADRIELCLLDEDGSETAIAYSAYSCLVIPSSGHSTRLGLDRPTSRSPSGPGTVRVMRSLAMARP